MGQCHELISGFGELPTVISDFILVIQIVEKGRAA